jgi:hypothetical protein
MAQLRYVFTTNSRVESVSGRLVLCRSAHPPHPRAAEPSASMVFSAGAERTRAGDGSPGSVGRLDFVGGTWRRPGLLQRLLPMVSGEILIWSSATGVDPGMRKLIYVAAAIAAFAFSSSQAYAASHHHFFWHAVTFYYIPY